MRYDVRLLKNGGERRIVLERDVPLAEGDAVTHESSVYSVIRVEAGHGGFDALIMAEWRGDVGSS